MGYGMNKDCAELTARILQKPERTEGEQGFISYIYQRFLLPAVTGAKAEPEANPEPKSNHGAKKKAIATLISRYENYIPAHALAKALKTTYKKLWKWLYGLMRKDKIEVSTIQNSWQYTNEQKAWKDSQGLFFISF